MPARVWFRLPLNHARTGAGPGATSEGRAASVERAICYIRDIWVTFGICGAQVGGLYRSTNAGSPSNASSVDDAYQVAFGKGSSDMTPAVYLFGKLRGSTLDTMFLSNDLGQTWIPISDPSVNGFGESSYLEGDMAMDNLVYVALAGRGIMDGMFGSGGADAGLADDAETGVTEAGSEGEVAAMCPLSRTMHATGRRRLEAATFRPVPDARGVAG